MKRIAKLIFVISLLASAYNLYVWARTYGLDSLWAITDIAPLRASVLWDYRLFYVLAAVIGIVEGHARRQRMDFVGHHRRLWLSWRIAATAIVGLGLVWLSMPHPLPLIYVVLTASAFVLWSGFSFVAGFPSVEKHG